MILKAFCLLDTKVSAFATPFFMPHIGNAVRACAELGQDMTTTVGRHPADFHLYEIGTYDDQTGLMEALRQPISHGPVLAFIKQPNQDNFSLIPETPRNGYHPTQIANSIAKDA